ncbi:flagellin [Shumkonia mesophila]|uniref:flagellin n=1 Tax=Shumkonia mesophila TaxID=2838854 RepID=UPI002934266D|nr:flagellin [Shumkonia mesophila]
MITRVSTFGLGSTMMNAALTVQSKYAETATQKASGLVAATYGELGAGAVPLLSAEDMMTQMKVWKSNTEIAKNRVQSMYSAVGRMIELLTSFRSRLSAAKSDAGSAATLNRAGRDLISDLASQMNLRMDGRYLFAGSSTGSPPVDTAKLAAPISFPSATNTSYYTGDDERAAVRISSQQTIVYGVGANSDGFEKALRAANIAAHLASSPLNTVALDETYDVATKALDTLIATQSALSDISLRLESAEKHQTLSLDLLNSITSDIKNADLAQVTVRLSLYDTQLQASYSALSKVTHFSLAKYL